MTQLTISEVARQVGVRASTIRYYEQVGILLPAKRVNGQRRYEESVVFRLAVVRQAQEAGFSLDEIRRLFFGFRNATPVSARWGRIAESKIVELDACMERLRAMRDLLAKLQTSCRCETVEECGAGILRAGVPPRSSRA